MAITQTDLDTLEAAIASGERVVQQDGKRIEYQSIPDMLRAAGYMRARLRAAGGVTRTTLVEVARD